MSEQITGRVRLPKGFDSQAESTIESTLIIQQGALEFPDGTFLTSSINTSTFVTTSSFYAFTSSYNSGSFSGSFRGDGSGLTGVGGTTINTSSFVTTSSFNAFTASINSFTASYSTGSFTGSFTGSLLGTASYADMLDGLDSTAFAQLSIQNIYTQTNTFRESTYYQSDTYSAAHKAIQPVLVSNAITVEVFNIYTYITYSEVDENRNCTAIFTYNIEDITTGKTVRGGQVLMVWSPTHQGFTAVVDTNAVVYGGDLTFDIVDDYTLGSEYVKLRLTNNSGGNVYIRGLLTIT
jgi:hypothetical protein